LSAVAWLGLAGPPPVRAADTSPLQLRERTNQGTVSVISGGVNGTYIRIASDLAAVLDAPGDLRILPIVGKGSVQNIVDLLYLRGVDVAIVQSDVLSHMTRARIHPGLAQRIRYIAKLYNEEFQLLAREPIRTVEDLRGEKVNVDVAGSGTAMTAAIVFDSLGIPVQTTNFDQALALDKLANGEIAAMAYVAGKPTELFRRIEAGRGLHFVEIPLIEALIETYYPSSLSRTDYPNLIAGDDVGTIAVGAVMAVYNWPADNVRQRNVGRFVDAFFGNFQEFRKPARHPKWAEVNLTATVPGWTRYETAERALERMAAAAGGRP
jgi:TRAP transporter TAXI family solute receptor